MKEKYLVKYQSDNHTHYLLYEDKIEAMIAARNYGWEMITLTESINYFEGKGKPNYEEYCF